MKTAKEVFNEMLEKNDECTSTEMMIEFAKMHVEKALNVGICSLSNGTLTDEDENKILKSYPLENIK